MADRDPRLAAFDVLVGTWDTASRHRLVDEVVWQTDDGRFPDALCVIGADVAEWFDSRGVRRTYESSIEDGVWRMWRDEDGFDQRMTATLAADEFEVVAERAETPGEWVRDMATTYRRR